MYLMKSNNFEYSVANFNHAQLSFLKIIKLKHFKIVQTFKIAKKVT
jgi:hypothetical protein